MKYYNNVGVPCCTWILHQSSTCSSANSTLGMSHCHRKPIFPSRPAPTSHQSSLDVLLLAGLAVLRFAPPGLQGRGLQGAAEGEGQGPGPLQGALVHGVQVDGGLLLALTARQEGHSCGVGTEVSKVTFLLLFHLKRWCGLSWHDCVWITRY